MSFYQIQNGETKEIFKTPKLEWCMIVGLSKQFSAVKTLRFLFGKNNIEALFQCPTPATNFSIENKKIPRNHFLPAGIYRRSLVAKLWDEMGSTGTLNISVVFQIEGIF